MFVKVEVYIPEDYVYPLMKEINDSGCIREGNYDYAFAATKVLGHWRPIEGSKPFSGEEGKISCEEEIKLEFRIRHNCIGVVRDLIKKNHPYEVPVVNFIPLIEEK